MKTTSLLAFLLVSFNVKAYDTSGCTPMRMAKQEARTPSKSNLRVQINMAPWERCWNAADGNVAVSYEWAQDSSNTNHKSQFWIRTNQDEGRTYEGSVSCRSNESLSYSYSSAESYTCKAQVILKIGYQKDLNIEVAPALDGRWDTKGYGDNYLFNLKL